MTVVKTPDRVSADLGSQAEIETVFDPSRAVVLLQPVRLEILGRMSRPTSATAVADAVGLSRQKINYHVRALADAGFLVRAGTRRKRNLIEQFWVAAARSYLLAPEILGRAAPSWRMADEAVSTTRLQVLLARSQSELARAVDEASAEDRRPGTLSLSAELRFRGKDERSRFAAALSQAVSAVVRDYLPRDESSEPAPDDGPAEMFRLVLGCYELPTPDDPRREDDRGSRIE